MKRITALSVAMVAAGFVLAPTAAHADDRVCTSSIGAETVDNVQVPDGASCTLTGTVVEGNVTVGTGATLTATDVDVDGNIQAEGHGDVTVTGSSRVGGSVQIEQGASADVRGTTITGDLQYFSNTGTLSASDNTIGGNVQATQNSGGLDIRGNTIGGNLQCSANDPAPTGGDNVVEGSAEDQCAALEGGTTPPPPAGTFCDTDDHFHEANIDKVAAAGITQGDDDGCFRPDAPVTRGQMAAFIDRAYDLAPGAATFCDTAGTTHEASIAAVAEAGIAEGTIDGCYRPAASVTRGQMASFIARAESLAPGGTSNFCDIAGTTHEDNIVAIADAGIAQGDSAGCFNPGDDVTRGQMATFLARALQL